MTARGDVSGPASLGQRALWLMQRLEPRSRAATVARALRLRGPLDPGALARALHACSQRHGALRTAFVERDGEPWREVRAHASLPLDVRDAAGLDDAALERALSADARRPWDLALAPLARATLYVRGAGEHVLLLALHHTIADLASLAVFFEDLRASYAAAITGAAPRTAPADATYADFVDWQHARLASVEGRRAADWWLARLRGAPARLDLPCDGGDAQAAPGLGWRVPLAFEAPEVAMLHALARDCGATLPALLLAAFQVLLARHTGQDDLVVGVPVPGRARREWARVLGCFVNTLPLRAGPARARSFRDLAADTRRALLAGLARQAHPLSRLVEELRLPRDAARAPFAQALFVFQRLPRATERGLAALAAGDPRAATRLHDVELGALPVDLGLAPADLTLELAADDGRLHGALMVDRRLASHDAARDWAARFRTLLRGIATAPHARPDELPLLPPDERRALLALGRGPVRSRAIDTVTELLARPARRAPAALALDDGRRCWTYARLEAGALRVAHALRRRGVRRGGAVGLALPRSLEAVAALVGTLKAGAACVPLDPALPDERLAAMLADARVDLVITADDHARGSRHAPVLALAPGGDLAELDGEPTTPLDDGPRGDDALSILFTSGTTGRPKGVVSTHAGLANRLAWFQETYPLRASDRVLHKTPLGFDVASAEVLGTLAAGATLVVAPPDAHRHAAALVELIAARRVTQAHFVPSLLGQFLARPDVERCAALRRVLCSGEALPLDLAAALRARLDVSIVNLYGPTEASVEVTHFELPRQSAGDVPIGRPIANAEARVADARGEPLAPMVAGEILLGGLPLARGYVTRPDLTAERFVPDPAADGRRLYRTGDFGRLRRDGCIEYLGRRDGQLKLRGVRLERDEVEAALRALPGVAEAAVDARGLGADARLVAFLVAREDARADVLSPAACRAALLQRLPQAAVPSAFVRVAALPRTPSGKVDRRALVEPEIEAAGDLAPSDDLERELAAVFEELLGRPVARDADFFQSGGHSLLAARLRARVQQRFGLDLPLRACFEAPTVEALAARLRAQGATAARVETIPRRARDDEPRPSFTQERLWFLDQLAPGPLYNLAFGLRLRGELDAPALRRAFEDVTTRHEALRTSLTLGADGRLRARVDGVAADWGEIDLARRERPARAALALALHEARRPFDLRRAPLARARLLRLGPRDHLLALVAHHAAADGWSLGLLLRELATLYAAFRAGRPSPLRPLERQYLDFAACQRARVEPRVGALLAPWLRRLEDLPPALDFPADRPRPRAPRDDGARHVFTLPAATVAALDALAARQGATRFMVLLAVYALLLARHAGRDDVIVGAPAAGRERAEDFGLVGCFVQTLPLRVRLRGAPTFRALLGQVRATAIEGLEHQDAPLQRLVEALNPARAASHSPLFEAAFALQDATGPAPDWPGLDARRVELDTGTARFELGLWLEPAAGHLAGVIEYRSDLFEPATVAALARRYAHLCAQAAASPDAPVASLTLALPGERRRVVVEWNRTARALPEPAALPALFTRAVTAAPDAVAVEHGPRLVTYAALAQRASRLARRLRARGVERETRVGVCLPRSPELVAALLGILEAGGVYVPLDPDFPAERLAFMRADCGARVIVTRPELARRLGFEGELVDVDAAGDDAPPIEPLPALSDALAYVLYTSGSSGRPKGVAVPQRAVVRLVCASDAVAFEARDRVAQLASPAFDAATFEIWGALLHGARLVIVERETTLEPRALARAFRAAGVSVTMLTTALFNRLAADEPDVLREVGTVWFGGETVDPRRVREALARPGRNRLLHGYGPTECTTAATWRRVERVEDDAATIPIGRPLANTQAYVLDADLRPLPPGVPGELYLGGPGLARGYEGRPDLTAERFIPDPLGSRGARLYRTGDRARWLASGELEFVGRADAQVKIRGQRIEPAEVEAVLSAQPGVRACAVLAREEIGERRLVAYVVPCAPGLDVPTLRTSLRARLPEAMVPSRFIELDELPLTTTGKVDRRALAARREREPESTPNLAALTPAERDLAAIWEELLGAAPRSPHETFFDAGGHSLLAAAFTLRVRQRLGRELPLRALFDDSTLSGLGRALDARGAAPERATLVPLGGDGATVVLVHALGGTVFGYRALAGALGDGLAVQGLQDFDLDAPDEPFEALAARHLATLRAHAGEAPPSLVGWSFGGLLAFEMARQAEAAGFDLDQVVLVDTQPPLGPAFEELARRPSASFLADDAARAWLGDAAGRASESEIERLARVSARHLAALRGYRPGRLGRQITWIVARDGPLATDGAARAAWRDLASGVEVVTAPGDHFDLLRPPHVDALAARLRERLRPAPVAQPG